MVISRILVGVAIGLIAALGCDNSGGNDKPPMNVQPVALAVLDSEGSVIADPVFHVGHPARIGLEIRSKSVVKDLALHLYIINQHEFDIDPASATQYLLGAASIDRVREGQHAYEIDMSIPYTDHDFDDVGVPVYDGIVLLADRDYYVFAQLDPADRIKEIDENDNRPALNDFGGAVPVVLLSSEKQDQPNVYLREIVLDVDLRMVDTDLLIPEPPAVSDFCTEVPPVPDPADPFDAVMENLANSQLGLTAILGVSGAYFDEGRPSPIPRVDLQATLRWQGKTPSDVWNIPLLVWDSESKAYQKRFSVLDVAPGVPRSVHVDMRLDASLDSTIADDIADLRTYLFESLPVCIQPVFGECGIDISTCLSVETLEECLATVDLVCAWDCFARESGKGSIEVELTAWDGEGNGASPLPGVELPGFEFDARGDLPEIHITPPGLADVADDVCQGVCPDSTGELSFEASLVKDFSSSATERLASARINFDAMGALGLIGASANANGSAFLTLFGRDFEILGLAANGAASPERPGGTYFELDLRSSFAFSSDRLLFSKTMAPCNGAKTVKADDLAWEVLSRKAEEQCKLDCHGNTSCEDACEALVQSFEQSKEVKRTFFISIVPVTAKFRAGAGVGFSAGIGLPKCEDKTGGLFMAHAGPYVEVDSEISAGVGIPGWLMRGPMSKSIRRSRRE